MIRQEGVGSLFKSLRTTVRQSTCTLCAPLRAVAAKPKHGYHAESLECLRIRSHAFQVVHGAATDAPLIPIFIPCAIATATLGKLGETSREFQTVRMCPADASFQPLVITAVALCCRCTHRFGTQILMNVPFTAIHFSTYEAGKRKLEDAGLTGGLPVELLAGGTAGACCHSSNTSPASAPFHAA